MKRVAIIGSTGSIGKNTLEVIKELGDYEVYALISGNNIPLLLRQAQEFNPEYVGSVFSDNEKRLNELVKNRWKTLIGIEGCNELAISEEVDILVIASKGTLTFEPLIKALRCGKRVATANKETIVAYAPILKSILPAIQGELIPIDSEHSGIYQSLLGAERSNISKIILPASGGPFYKRESFEGISPEEALEHPNWKMGSKVTIDSATLMNKGFEVIEASVLFGLSSDEIEVVIHPQSIVHGMVLYKDGSVISQLSKPDMRIPIRFALTAPEHRGSAFDPLDISEVKTLTFYKVDENKFPLLSLAYYALKEGGTLPAVLAASDEVAVNAFLEGKIGFIRLMDIVIEVTQSHSPVKEPEIKDIIEAEEWAIFRSKELIG
ncbi:1-deoxy-D-xylulose-5-phosphate reductoisomerase [candidate division WOR-3 bacterium]|nr:1-deoxy-D-xylulose-5-phosphate reductoisomerase [candidate division WOR-3 bacterium]MCK4527391.1 1-deoxy-D-xylulose-5-phosphate reductoisomerase [candidate division WOR-3 bacterium]